MASYSYKPDKKAPKVSGSSAAQAKPATKLFDSFPKNKMYVAMALVLLSFVFIGGSSITGNLIGTDPEYAQLSQLPDFPDLSKQSANVELYKCRNDLEGSRTQYDQCSSGLSNIKTAYDTCSNEKNNLNTQVQQTNANLEASKLEAATLKAERDKCVQDKSSVDVTLGTCNSDLNEVQAKNVQLEDQLVSVLENYAKQVCCIQKQFQPSLNYYRVENNKIVCTDDGEDVPFSCS